MRTLLLTMAILFMALSPALAQSGDNSSRRVYNTRVTGNTPVFIGAQASRNSSSGSAPVYLSSQGSYGSGGGPLAVKQLVKGVSNAADGRTNFSNLNNFSPYGGQQSKKYSLGVSPDEVRRRQELRRKEAEEREKIISEQMRTNNSAYQNPADEAEQYRSTFQGTQTSSRNVSQSQGRRTVPKIYVTDRSNIQLPQKTFGRRSQ